MQACSGLALERDPLPDVEQWAAIDPGAERIRHGLEQLYSWYERNEQLTYCVLRDAEFHDLTREIVQSRMMPTFSRASELLGANLGEASRVLLAMAVDFACWRVLSRTHHASAAAALMSKVVFAA